MKKEQQKKHLIDIMKSDEELGLYKETFEDYLQRLKDRRTEDIYPYTDYDLEKYRDYIFDCYTTNLSVYKCLEWMYFVEKEILPQQIWKKEKMESVKQIIKGQELFKESNDRARKVLSEIKSLPIQETFEKIL